MKISGTVMYYTVPGIHYCTKILGQATVLYLYTKRPSMGGIPYFQCIRYFKNWEIKHICVLFMSALYTRTVHYSTKIFEMAYSTILIY